MSSTLDAHWEMRIARSIQRAWIETLSYPITESTRQSIARSIQRAWIETLAFGEAYAADRCIARSIQRAWIETYHSPPGLALPVVSPAQFSGRGLKLPRRATFPGRACIARSIQRAWIETRQAVAGRSL